MCGRVCERVSVCDRMRVRECDRVCVCERECVSVSFFVISSHVFI